MSTTTLTTEQLEERLEVLRAERATKMKEKNSPISNKEGLISFQLERIRAERNQKLIASDWTQGADVPDSIKTPYATYRQQLRDLPASITLPKIPLEESDWPTEPSI